MELLDVLDVLVLAVEASVAFSGVIATFQLGEGNKVTRVLAFEVPPASSRIIWIGLNMMNKQFSIIDCNISYF
mgnify:CR=1 FL=1